MNIFGFNLLEHATWIKLCVVSSWHDKSKNHGYYIIYYICIMYKHSQQVHCKSDLCNTNNHNFGNSQTLKYVNRN